MSSFSSVRVNRTSTCLNAGPRSFACPKSISTSFGPGCTIRFPGCGSAWKKPCRTIISAKANTRIFATSAGSTPIARIDGASVIFAPAMYSIVNTRLLVYSQ